ncbi:glycosyl hydrolase family 28-related protein [Ornithinicoccus halotolerans]|uniref:glycosyl hydrolase family 28-related protein n=1 Tax=Ornithinicoccus halotolerans TaxID=1748220 RepID=UPI0012960E62|nr:glycosyl hydrolase family 28-related protein [Ornithinicoccus halotolerans]
MQIDRRSIFRGGVVVGALTVTAGCTSCPPPEEADRPEADPVMVTGDHDVGWLLNVEEFGVTSGEADQTENFQRAIDAAHASDRTLFIPGGRYTADGLVLRNGSRLLGAGAETSVIHAVPGSENEALLRIGQGVLQHVRVEGLGLTGAGNRGQHGLLIRAERGEEGVSGLWHSSFANMRIYDFDAAQIWLAGGGTEARDPIQFLDLYNMVVERKPGTAESICVLMSGQVNQTTWIGGRIDAFGAESEGSPGVNLKICPQLERYTPGLEPAAYLSNKVGHTHVFSGTTFQQAQVAVFLDGAESVTFDTCHFEGLGSAILLRGAEGIRVDRCHFANATVASAGSGYCVRAEEDAHAVGYGNMFIGQFGDMAATDGSGATVQMHGSQGTQVAVTAGLTRSLEATSVLGIGAATTVVLTGAGQVSTIEGSHFPGASIHIRAAGGEVVFEGGGNLHLGGGDSLRLADGGTASFVRFDDGPQWTLTSVVGAL